MFRKIKSLSVIKKLGLGLAALIVIGAIGSAGQPKTANLDMQKAGSAGVLGSHTGSDKSASKPKSKEPVVTTKTETKTQSIPFSSATVSTPALPKGTSKITTPGVDGVLTFAYKVTYTDDIQTGKELISQTTTTTPITQVTSVGTYVAPAPKVVAPAQPSCPNGTYVNSAGNTVCSPYASNAPPAGATARCTDGTYSFSQSHSGTCSHHGGVSVWL